MGFWEQQNNRNADLGRSRNMLNQNRFAERYSNAENDLSVQKIMEREGLNVASFARRIGVVDQTIRGIVVQRRNKPGFDLIVRILQTFDWVNAEWLILGVGEMSKPEQENLNNSERYSIKDLVMYLKEKDVKLIIFQAYFALHDPSPVRDRAAHIYMPIQLMLKKASFLL